MSKDKFVPLREKGFKSTDCDFDHISWDPTQIYNARAILLNLDKIDQFVNRLDPKILLLLQELKIESENQDFNISGFDKNGEATAGKSVSKNKSVQKSELGTVNQKNIAIKIAFKKIFEGLQEKNINPKEINSEFAKEVDKELQAILIRLTLKRFGEEYQQALKETFGEFLPLIIINNLEIFILPIVYTLLNLAAYKAFLIQNKFLYGNEHLNISYYSALICLNIYFFNSCYKFIKKFGPDTTLVNRELIESFKIFQLTKLKDLLKPKTYWKKLALPIMMLMSGEPLVKENNGE